MWSKSPNDDCLLMRGPRVQQSFRREAASLTRSPVLTSKLYTNEDLDWRVRERASRERAKAFLFHALYLSCHQKVGLQFRVGFYHLQWPNQGKALRTAQLQALRADKLYELTSKNACAHPPFSTVSATQAQCADALSPPRHS